MSRELVVPVLTAAAGAAMCMVRRWPEPQPEPEPEPSSQPEPQPAPLSRRAVGAGNVREALADGLAVVDVTQRKDTKEPQQHGVANFLASLPADFLDELFPRIKAAWKPHTVKYNNTNAYIKADDASKSGTGGTQEQVDWKVSCYMELDPSLGGQMQKRVACNKELLAVSLPMLEQCDAQFSAWYRGKKGADSIHKLVRLQSFITRYRVNPDESAGLLRHIDGVQVDGSLILALPTDVEWRGSGGGVTVWEGPEEDEVQWDYPMNPGDVCFLDHYVWHQGNPITTGERWCVPALISDLGRVRGLGLDPSFAAAAGRW